MLDQLCRLDKLWAEEGDDEETTLLGELLLQHGPLPLASVPRPACPCTLCSMSSIYLLSPVPGGDNEEQEGGRQAPAPAPPGADNRKLASLDAKLDALSTEVSELKALLKASLSQGFASK